MSDSFDDFLADPPVKRPRRTRPIDIEGVKRVPDGVKAARSAVAQRALEEEKGIRLARKGVTAVEEKAFFLPVGVNFLHRVLRMDQQTIRTRLRDCPRIDLGNDQRSVYHFHEAIQYLVKPKMSAEQFARTLNKTDLPPEVNKAFWDAQRSRVKYKIEAQEAWETEDVIQVLGDVAMTIKDSLTMVVEELRSRAKLTDDQCAIVEGYMDELRKQVRDKLIELPKERQTKSMVDQPMFGVKRSPDPAVDIPVGDFDDDDYEDDE